MFLRIWLGLLSICLLLSLFTRHDVLFFFTTLLGLGSLASLVSSRHCLYGITYKRRLRDERVFPGEETLLSVEVTNAKPLPLAWLLIRDQFPEGLALHSGTLESTEQQEAPTRILTSLLSMRWYERVTRTYPIRADRRGVYSFGPTTITSGDIFGFRRQSTDLEERSTLLVYPKIVPVSGLAMRFEKPAGEEKAERRVVEDPLRTATVREYVPGDSIRHIHWKSTARLGSLQTKVFDPGSEPMMVILVDLQTVENPYSLVPEYLELIITAAASLAVHALENRQSVGLWVNGGPRQSSGYWTVVPPGRSPAQATHILDALARLDGFRLIPFHQLLRRAMPRLPYGSSLFLITAQVTDVLLSAVLALQDVGHPTVLLTVGEEEPQVNRDILASFHLGGRDAWQHLEALELA